MSLYSTFMQESASLREAAETICAAEKCVAERVRLYLITDDRGRSEEELAAIVGEAIVGGVTAVQVREKSASGGKCARILHKLAPICEASHVALLVNADLLGRLSPGVPCDGVHLGARLLADAPADAGGVRQCLAPLLEGHCDPRTCLLGYSAHEVSEAREVLAQGASFVTLSPIFPTPKSWGTPKPRGAKFIAEARQALPGAVLVALGGVGPENAREVMRAGADGIAVIRAIMDAPDPRQAARLLRERIAQGLAEK